MMKRRLIFVVAVLALLSCRAARAAEMVIQRGHVGQITRVAISPNGEYLASAAGGDAIKLWQAARGEFIRDLPDAAEELPLAWSPDGSTLLTAARNINYARAQPTAGIRVRQMPSGKIVGSLRGVSTPLFFDGKIIRTTNGKVLRDWNIADGKLISTRKLQASFRKTTLQWNGETPRAISIEGSLEDNANERYFSFSRNGKYLVFGGEFGGSGARVWDANSGRLLHQIQKKDAAFGLAAVSDDGTRIVTQGENPNWSPPGPDSPGTEASYARNFPLHLWDLKTKKKIRIWPGFYSLSGGARLLQFSRDGKQVFGGGSGSARVYDVATGKVRAVEASGFQDISSDGKLWANGYIGNLRVTETQSGKVLSSMPGTMRGGDTLVWSPDGKHLVGGSHLQVWDMERAALLQPSPSDYLLRARWLNNTTIQTENLNRADSWSVDAKNQKFALSKSIAPGFSKGQIAADRYHNEVFLSPDGKMLLTNAKDFNKRGTLYVWDASGQKLLKTIEVNKRENGSVDNVSLTWLPDSKRFVTSTRSGIEIWNVALGKRETLLKVPADYPPPATPDYPYSRIMLKAVSPDGKYFATSNPQGEAHGMDVWDMTSTPRRIRTLSTKLRRNASFSPDGKWLAIGDFIDESQGRTEVWKWREGTKPHFILPVLGLAGSSAQEAPAWSPDGNRIAIGAQGATEVFDANNGKLLGRLAIGGAGRDEDKSDWLMWTPEGYFSAPDGGRKRVRWMEGGVLLALDSPRDKQLRKEYFQPSRVGKILSGATQSKS